MFLKYDQDKLIKKYGLKHDEEYLYLNILEQNIGSIAETVLLNMPQAKNGRTAENIQLL